MRWHFTPWCFVSELIRSRPGGCRRGGSFDFLRPYKLSKLLTNLKNTTRVQGYQGMMESGEIQKESLGEVEICMGNQEK